MALLPPFIQRLMGYPVIDVGLLMAPLGVGTMVAMMTVGKLSGKVDARLQVVLGLLLTSLSLWEMTQFTTDVSGWDIVRTGVVQGLGIRLHLTNPLPSARTRNPRFDEARVFS